MSRIGVIELTHSIICRKCGAEVRGGTVRRLYARFTIHVWRRHDVSTADALKALIALVTGGIR